VLYNILNEFNTPKNIYLHKTCLNEACCDVHAEKHLSDAASIQNYLKRRDVYYHCFSTSLLHTTIGKSNKSDAI
jgi:hypothetical protein